MWLGDNCDECQQDYTFQAETDHINLYDDDEYNHIFAVCPNCGNQEIIFIPEEALEEILGAGHGLPVRVFHAAPPDIVKIRESVEEDMRRNREDPDDKKKRPEREPPRDWIRSVMDDIREFGGKCSDNCGHFDHRGRVRHRPTK